MNVLIYGYGLKGGGFYSALYFLKKGHSVRVTDLRDEKSLGESIELIKKQGAEVIAGLHRVEDFKWADLVIKTPAISPKSPFLEYSKKTMTDFTYLLSDPHTEKVKLIFITGTIGKSTTSAAVCHALNKIGKKARMCGNIGSSPFTELEEWEKSNVPEYLICELSSWQLRDINEYLKEKMPNIEFLALTKTLFEKDDLYSDIQQYYYDKIQPFGPKVKNILCTSADKNYVATAVNRSIRRIASIEYYSERLQKSIPPNLQTAFAILKKLGFSAKEINKVLKSYKGIPHRNEIIKHIGNLLVINDSASSIPQAVSFTLNNLKGLSVNIICGGTGSKLSATSMVNTLKNVASITLLDGSFTQNKLIPELNAKNIPFNGPFNNMKQAVDCAMSLINKKSAATQVLLLSPGASALELFTNEYERGDSFKSCFKQ